MTKDEFKAAFELAHNDGIPWNTIDDSVVHGCALPEFRGPVNITLLVVARFIRYQCQYIFRKTGGDRWDTNELDNIAVIARKKFTLVEDFKTAIARAALIGKEPHGNNRD